MEAKFKKGQSVRITKRNGEVIDGVIRVWTVICVPEDAIQELR